MVSTLQIGRVGRRSTGYPHEAGLCFLFLERGEVGYRGVEGADQARPANSRLSVETLTFSPSLMKRGTRISRPVWRRADLVTLPLERVSAHGGLGVDDLQFDEDGQLQADGVAVVLVQLNQEAIGEEVERRAQHRAAEVDGLVA